MNPDRIAADRTADAPRQLSLPLRFRDRPTDPSTEQDHPEQFEPQRAEPQQ